jgi:hypothetical protein
MNTPGVRTVTTLAPRLAAVVVALVGVAPLAAADPPPSIERLIEQLGSPSFPTRERATKALRERGPEALPALRKALESKDEEVRKRAEGLIPGLEIDEALLPKRVKLTAKDAPLSQVLQDVEKQTGLKVQLSAAKKVDPKVTVDAAGIPFWEALDLIGKSAGQGPVVQGYPAGLHLDPTVRRSPFVNIRGPFRLEATWFHEDRDVDFTETKPGSDGWRNQRLTLAVSVLAEPRLTLLKVHPAKVEEAIDSDGKSLLEPADQQRESNLQRPMRGTFRGEHLHSADVRLRRASETAKTAKVIRGTIPVQAILIRKPVVVSARVTEATGTTFRAGSESLVITRVQNQGGNNLEVTIRVPHDQTQPQREWHERFHVEDDAGNKYQMNRRGTSSNGIEYNISMYFAAPFNNKKVGAPTKLIFEDWVVHDYPIPFEFRDVPLP